MAFEVGEPVEQLREVGSASHTGTTVTFWPSDDIFETTHFDFETLRSRFQQMAFLNKGLTISLVDERDVAPSEEPGSAADENGEEGRSEEHTSELQSRGHIVCR